MTRFLLATRSVHLTAAACDYLASRLSPGDAVVAVTVEDGSDPRLGGDALNVAEVRLGHETDLETRTRTGDPAEEILEAAAAVAADELLVGRTADATAVGPPIGTTATRVLERTDRPAIVLPSAA